MTCFIEGMSDKTLRWDLRKAKPATADHASALAVEINSFLEIENGSAESSHSVNRVSTDISGSDTMTEFVCTLRREMQRERPPADDKPKGGKKSNDNDSRNRMSSETNDSTRTVTVTRTRTVTEEKGTPGSVVIVANETIT